MELAFVINEIEDLFAFRAARKHTLDLLGDGVRGILNIFPGIFKEFGGAADDGTKRRPTMPPTKSPTIFQKSKRRPPEVSSPEVRMPSASTINSSPVVVRIVALVLGFTCTLATEYVADPP
ncbi:hypothetical protein Ndes2526B_g06646 [Nannochloris sp. 'desiccata']